MTSFSEQIRACRDGVVKNPYQGSDKKVLFVCSMGILRSATGARLYADKYNTRSAGSWDDALIPVTPILLEWADEVVFVNTANYDQVMKKLDPDESFRLLKKSRVLDIPDAYPHMALELIKAFDEQYESLSYSVLETA